MTEDVPDVRTVGIRNARLVTDVFGYWPSFHDAEVLSVALNRGDDDEVVLEAKIYVFEMTSAVDLDGHYVLDHESLVTLRFARIGDLRIDGFNHQNVLWSLQLTQVGPESGAAGRWRVAFNGTFGMHAEFACDSISVCAIEPL